MIRRTLCASALLLLAAGLIQAQGDPRKDPEGPADLELRFHDGSTLKKVAIADKLTVQTKFGKLTIDTKEIRKIEFGLQMSDDISKKIDDALVRLQGDNFQAREAAAKELLALGRYSYPALLKLSKGSDPETTRRVEGLVKTLRDKLPENQRKMKPEDLIHTGDSVIAGKIVGPFKVRTKQFGEASLDLTELQSIRSLSGINETAVAVDAGKYGINRNVWLDTGITIEPDSRLLITASGQVDMLPQQAGQFLTGPDGSMQIGKPNNQHWAGALLGRIGEKGPVFIVGQKHDSTVAQEGKLYLQIVPWQGQASGSFDVKVTVGPS